MDRNEFEALQSILKDFFYKQISANVKFYSCQISESISLSDREKEIVNKAAPKRVYEFSAGRMCAKKCLSFLGVNDFEILQGPFGEPIWPEGITGSITHHSGMACAVSMAAKDGSIGIDLVNLSESLPDPTAILTDYELAIETVGNVENVSLLLFSMKESVIKVLSPLLDEYVEFKDIEIILDEWPGTVKFRGERMNINLHWLSLDQFAVTVAILNS